MLSVPAFAQQEVTDDDVNSIAREMYCPVCESEPLDVCGTQACQDWRAEIRIMLTAGATKQEIFDDFQARYGSRTLSKPPFSGVSILLWVGPLLAIVAGGLWFLFFMRKAHVAIAPSSAQKQATTSKQQPAKKKNGDLDSYIDLIEQELSNR